MGSRMVWCGLGVMAMVGMMVGCEGVPALRYQQMVERAPLPLEALPNPETKPSVPEMPTSYSGLEITPPNITEVTGTYQFKTPDTTTRVKRITENFEQYAIYWGQPKPDDKPFVVITVGKNLTAEAEKNEGNLQASEARAYLLNGLIAKEWTGYTKDRKQPFAELLVKRPGAGDQLHVLAIVKNEEQRKTALEILGSIKWEADRK